MIIEKVTHHSWEENIQQYILNPLHMQHSGFDFRVLDSPDKSIGYQALNEWTQQPDIIWDATVSYAAGSLYTTTTDLLAWAKAVTEKKILTKESWEKSFTPNLHNYGYGWETATISGVRMIAHSGGLAGFSAQLLIAPGNDLQVILLTNVMENSHVTAISHTLAAMVLNKPLPYEIMKAPPVVTMTADELRPFAGAYQLDKTHVMNIIAKDGKLFISSTSNRIPVTRLLPEGKEDFLMANIFLPVQLTFERNKTGNVIGMTLTKDHQTFKWKKI